MLTRWLIYLVAAVALAAASPLAATLLQAEAGNGGFVAWWFFSLPRALEELIQTPREQRLWVWAAAYTLQYLTVFALVEIISWLARPRDPIERRVAFDTAVRRYYQSDDEPG
jgi:hypothetical protein